MTDSVAKTIDRLYHTENHKCHNKEIDHVYILDNGEIRIETVDYVKNNVYQKHKK